MGTDICRVRCLQRRMPGQTALGTAHTTADPIREIRTAISQNRRRLRKIFSRRAFCDGTADNADERRYFEATTSRALISAIRGGTSGFIGGTAVDDSFPAKLGKFKIEKQRQL